MPYLIDLLLLSVLAALAHLFVKYQLLFSRTPPIRLPNGKELEHREYLLNLLHAGERRITWESRQNGVPVAVKRPFLTLENNKAMEHEIEMLKTANPHPNVIKLMGNVIIERHSWIITELMQGNLYEFLERYPDISWGTKLAIAQQILKGLVHLHHRNTSDLLTREAIVHQNLNPSHLLVRRFTNSPEVEIVIAGFSRARKVEQLTLSVLGTHTLSMNAGIWPNQNDYTAPELYKGIRDHDNKQCDPKSDMFSVGLILWFLATKQKPQRTDNEIALGIFDAFQRELNTNRQETRSIFGSRSRPTYPNTSFFGPIINKCLNIQPENRSNAQETLAELQSIRGVPR